MKEQHIPQRTTQIWLSTVMFFLLGAGGVFLFSQILSYSGILGLLLRGGLLMFIGFTFGIGISTLRYLLQVKKEKHSLITCTPQGLYLLLPPTPLQIKPPSVIWVPWEMIHTLGIFEKENRSYLTLELHNADQFFYTLLPSDQKQMQKFETSKSNVIAFPVSSATISPEEIVTIIVKFKKNLPKDPLTPNV